MKKEIRNILLMLFVIVAVTGFPYVKKGLCAYFPDLMYHMLRIEGVKVALLSGEYPVRIYTNFFAGYGYGSPLFYPDIFLFYPAILRILNVSPVLTWKIFALTITVIATLSTFFSIKYICKNTRWSIAATFMIMLSQFYLADVHLRAGISEYLAFVFVPILMAGVYDFFAHKGEKTYLIGVAFVGLLLSHSIMTFIGVLITLIIFVRMAFVKRENNYLFDKVRMKRLIITAICTILVVSYYLFPMLEQMSVLELRYTEPWAKIGKNTQPFSSFFRMIGYFSTIAYVGIGGPILLVMFAAIFLKKTKDQWANAFLYGGIVLFLITTDIIPWNQFEDTILNMIQFTYRFWPYALFCVVTGSAMIFAENSRKTDLKYEKILWLGVIACTVLAGLFQNRMTAWVTSEQTSNITVEYLNENSNYVGAGEWLPIKLENDIINLVSEKEILKDGNCYTYPLIYYKGYEAWKVDEMGRVIQLEVKDSDQGLVQVVDDLTIDGKIDVKYQQTLVQRISNVISMSTITVLLFLWLKKHLYNFEKH